MYPVATPNGGQSWQSNPSVHSRNAFPPLLASVLLLAFWVDARAERLPIRAFDSRDGLAGDRITCLLQDSRGFLWVGADTGLSRFDGRRFTRWTTADGLPHPVVRSLAEDGRGRLWVGTSYGLAVLGDTRDLGGRPFQVLPPAGEPLDNLVYAVLPDGDGVLAGFGTALTRVTHHDGRFSREVLVRASARITALTRDASGRLWLGTEAGLAALGQGGTLEVIPVARERRDNHVVALAADAAGRLWVATRALCTFDPARTGGAPHTLFEQARWWRPASPQPPPFQSEGPVCWGREAGVEAFRLMQVTPTREGEVWLATTDGLFNISTDAVTRLDERAGLVDSRTTAVLQDDAGNLWIGSERRGLQRLRRQGFVSFEQADGLATSSTSSVFWDPRFGVVVVGYPPGTAVHRVEGGRLVAVPLPLPAGTPLGWGRGQVTLVDRVGEWWVPTDGGLYRLPAVQRLEELTRVRPLAVYGAESPLGSDLIFRLFEDSRGDLWVGAGGPAYLSRLDRQRTSFVRYGTENGVPADTPTAFAETADGTVWVGFYRGGVGRLVGAHLEVFREGHGLPGGFVSSLLVDRRGRLWVGTTRGGLARLEDPAASRPSFSRLTIRQGLASDGVFALVEDEEGHIWVGTQLGVDRLDPESGQVVHLSAADGLSSNSVQAAARDGDGNLWFATLAGVSRLSPRLPPPLPLRPLRLTAISVDGVQLPLPAMGTTAVDPLHLPVGTRHLRLAFTAVDLARGENLRFQYRLAGQHPAWQVAGDGELSLVLPGPGAGTLELRAVRDGQASPVALVPFEIAPPLWRRWWFLTLLGGLAVGGALLAHRARVASLQRVARLRDRIAADLHDELGLLCSRIALLAGVSRTAELAPGQREAYLEEIAAAARELLDTSANVVWAVDPAGDTLDSLLGRLRRLGHDVFERDGIAFSFSAAEVDGRLPVDGQLRREVFLVVKEAFHNARRHARPRRVDLSVGAGVGRLELAITDDGVGLPAPPAGVTEGRGMANMRRRAAALGGCLRWERPPAGGTRVVLEVPLGKGRQRRMFMRLGRRKKRGRDHSNVSSP